jgi:DNA-binding FadR family transcriptional regulator
LSQTTIGIRQRIAPFRRAQFAIAGRLAKSHAEHDAIVSAVLRGDAEIASELMRTHVNIVRAASWNYVHGLELTAPDPRPDVDVDPAIARVAAPPTQI